MTWLERLVVGEFDQAMTFLLPLGVPLSFLAAVAIYVMTRNYLHLRRVSYTPSLTEDERIVDEIRFSTPWGTWHTVLTNVRVFQWQIRWFWSRQKFKTLTLMDLHSVKWRLLLNPWLLVLTVLVLYYGWNPFFVPLLMAFLESRWYTITFNPPFQVHYSFGRRIVAHGYRRTQLPHYWRFFQTAYGTWATARLMPSVPAPVLQSAAGTTPDPGFTWGRPVWVYVLVWMVLGTAQRVIGPHIWLEDYLFTPLYVGMPVAVAARHLRDAVWMVVMGFPALLTIKFPGVWGPPDGGMPDGLEYLWVWGTLGATALGGHALARWLHPSMAAGAIVFWLLPFALFRPEMLYDLSVYARFSLAVAACFVLTEIDQIFRNTLAVKSTLPESQA